MINFLKYRWLYLIISTFVIGLGLYSIISFGYAYSIDFTGGSIIEYQIKPEIKKENIEKVFRDKKIKFSSITKSQQGYLIRSVAIDEKQEKQINETIKNGNNLKEIKTLRFETVGPSLGKETVNKTVYASIIAVIGILLYMTYAFKKISYGLAAIIAMIHDFVVLIGVYSLLNRFFGAEVDTLFVTAALTTMSFSVHDTIVVFDKIRELRQFSSEPLETITNKALTTTMVRSLNNSLTIVLMLIPLIFFSGEAMKYFAAALLVGTITGTYSSPFIATPLFVFLEKRIGSKR